MAEEVTKESLIFMLRMKHAEVLRRGKPRLGQVYPTGEVDLMIDVTPAPSKEWRQCMQKAAEGTVMEGRVTTEGIASLSIQSAEDELEADVRRVDELIAATNQNYDRMFKDAKNQLDEMNQQPIEEDPAERKRRLEERLNKF